MTDYPFGIQLAVAALDENNVIRNGQIFIYATTDTAGTTPLALTDLSGLPMTNPLMSNGYGYTRPFITTEPQVKWKSGAMEGLFDSFAGMLSEATEAKIAAQESATAALAAAASADASAGLVGSPTDAAVAAAINSPTSQTRTAADARYVNQVANATALGGKVSKGDLVLNVRDYGAKGDGVTDDSAAIQAALNAVAVRGVVIIPYGAYKIVTGLTSATPDIRIRSEGGRLLAATAEMTVLTVTGARTRMNLHIDGANLAANGLSMSVGGCEVRDGTYENFYSATGGSNAIRATTSDGVVIERNTLRNVVALGDTTAGNFIGAARAIVITSPSAAVADNIVRDNRIQNITGEEGDAIQFLFGATSPFLSGRGIVSNNVVDTVSRRAIKIQAADCEVSGNTYRHSTGTASYPAALIDIIHSSRVTVRGNTLDATYFMGIQVTGPAGNRVTDITVTNNVVRSSNNNIGIYIMDIANSRVSNNEIFEGVSGMSITSVIDTVILENVFRASVGVANGMRALSNCSGLVISRNIAYGNSRVWFIQNDSPGAVVENNHIRYTGAGGGCIRHTDTAIGSLYRGNTAPPGGAGIYNTTYTDAAVSDSKGSSATGGGDHWWSTLIPSTEQPTQTHHKGDVAFNAAPVASGTVGWVCVSNGTPGVWKTFGNISA